MAGETTATPQVGNAYGGTAGTGAQSAGTTGAAQEKAQQAAGAAKEQASQVAGQAQEKVGQVADQAKQQAGQAAGQAKSQVKTQIDQRSTQAGELVTTQASDIRAISDTLREKGQDKPAQYVEQAASRIEGLGSYLTQSNADRILHDVEDFARARPTAVIGAGALLGFLASRFLKASSSERYTTRSSQLPNTYDRPAYTTPAPVGGTGNTLSGGVTPGVTPAPTGTGFGSPAETDRLGGPAGAGIPPTPTTGGL